MLHYEPLSVTVAVKVTDCPKTERLTDEMTAVEVLPPVGVGVGVNFRPYSRRRY